MSHACMHACVCLCVSFLGTISCESGACTSLKGATSYAYDSLARSFARSLVGQVSGNQLTQLPDTLGGLTELRELDVTGNQVQVCCLDDMRCCVVWPSLSYMFMIYLLAERAALGVCKVVPSLLSVWCSATKKYRLCMSMLWHCGSFLLQELPGCVAALVNLEKLHLAKNNVTAR